MNYFDKPWRKYFSVKKIVSIMKLATFALIVCSFNISATVYSQTTKLSLSVQNQSIKDVLFLIEKQSDFRFIYESRKINLEKKVSVSVKEQTVETILKQIFKNGNIEYEITENNLILISPSNDRILTSQEKFQAKKRVIGVVKDANGEPIVGANVSVKGTSRGTITDMDGRFDMEVVKDDVVVISYIGFRAEERKVIDQRELVIVLKEDSQSLDELVVIGYGAVKKSNLTSSVSKITDEAVSFRPISTVSEAFQGQLAGVRSQAVSGLPGKNYSIQIRGLNTINGDSSPLYVIDGVPRDDMNDLNSNDILSIQVLKDASATSIYGSRGANGVVLIETKEGTGKPTLTFDAYYGIQNAEKKLDMMDANEWIALNIYQRNLAHLMNGGSMNDPMFSRAAENRIPDEWYTNSVNVDWQDAIMRTAPIQSYNASASAKGDIGQIYFSAGYLNQDGIVRETYYEKANIRLNATMNIAPKFKIGVNFDASSSEQDTKNAEAKEGAIHKALMMASIVRLDQNTQEYGFIKDAGNNSNYVNPVETLKNLKAKDESIRLNASIFGEWKILPELMFKTQYSQNYVISNYEYFCPANVTENNKSSGNSNSSTVGKWSIQNTLSYEKQLNESHSLNVLLGQSAESRKLYKISAEATDWPFETVETLNVATTPLKAATDRNAYTNASFFGRVSYNFQEKYLLSGSLRYDGSSRFGFNSKWGLFPSFSAGWKVNEESFMKSLDWLSLLKIRVSWGMAGNDRIGDYAYMSLLGIDKFTWGNSIISGIAPNNIGNEDLKWETTKTLDFGFDFSAFNNRVQLNFDYYINTTDDLLFNVAIPRTTGYSSYLANVGSVRNKGWEIDLTTHNIVGDFNWSSSLNLSRNRNEVLDMGEINQIRSSNYDANFITRVGGSVSEFYAYEANGILTRECFDESGTPLVPIATGQVEGNVRYVDQNKDGVITAEDQIPTGNNLPDLTFGFTNRFSWNNIDLSILLQGQIGGDIMFIGQRQYDYGSKVAAAVNQMSRWLNCYKDSKYIDAIPTDYIKEKGINMDWDGKTPVPDEGYGYQSRNDTRRIYDATFLRIKNITLGYTFPKKILSKTPFENLRVYFSADNIATFDKYPGYNPEANGFGNSTTQLGVDYCAYPLSRRLIMGVNVVF